MRRLLAPFLRHPRASQIIKWTVYSALLINFAVYLVDDWQAYNSTLPVGAPWAEIAETFSTTIDMIAWLGLVFLFELETYALPDEKYKGWVPATFIAVRVLCYISICLAAVGYATSALDYRKAETEPGLNSLCEIADQERYFQINVIDYEEITSKNCTTLSQADVYYRIPGELSVMDEPVRSHSSFMGWIDVLNAVVWLIVVFLIEIEVWFQSADRFSSRALPVVRLAKTMMYAVLIGNAVIWVVTGYPIYAWDAFLWIFGFWAIELNLAEWENERADELAAQPPETGATRQ